MHAAGGPGLRFVLSSGNLKVSSTVRWFSLLQKPCGACHVPLSLGLKVADVALAGYRRHRHHLLRHMKQLYTWPQW